MQFSTCDPSNIEEIKQLFIQTFTDSEGQAEGLAVGKIAYDLMTGTDANDLYCFIATENEQIVANIIFSRLTFENSVNAFLLSPVATHTSCQGKGVGQKLINFGLNILKENGVELAFTYGDINFYAKVGFSQITEELAKAPHKLGYPEGWLAQSLVSDNIEPIAGSSSCVEAFNNPELW